VIDAPLPLDLEAPDGDGPIDLHQIGAMLFIVPAIIFGGVALAVGRSVR